MSDLILVEKIKSKIFFIRERKVMLDRDLAEMYEIETRALTQAVRRNLKRFPEDFMFVLEEQEFNLLISQIVTSNIKLPTIGGPTGKRRGIIANAIKASSPAG